MDHFSTAEGTPYQGMKVYNGGATIGELPFERVGGFETFSTLTLGIFDFLPDC